MLLLFPYYLTLEYLLIAKFYLEMVLTKHPPTNWKQGKKGNVLIVPGVGGSYVPFKKICEQLNLEGYRIHTLKGFGYNKGTIKSGSKVLETYLNKNNLKNIYLVSHSKGGIITRHFLTHSGQSFRVKRAVTIATPHHGSILTIFLKSIWEIFPSSKVIKDLATDKKGVNKILNIYPRFDNHVIPNQNLILDGATNIKVSTVGHNRILISEKTISLIKGYFAK
jgi:esterase/lipase